MNKYILSLIFSVLLINLSYNKISVNDEDGLETVSY